MKRFLNWFLLLNKRLYKKISFLLILLLIPVLVLSYNNVAQEDSGIITIALAQEGSDAMATDVIKTLLNEDTLVRYISCETPDVAKQLVSDGEADAAWIFPVDMEEKVYRFVNSSVAKNAFIQVIERETSVPVVLAREKLSGAVFGHCTRAMYLTYIREHAPQLQDTSDEELLAYYDAIMVDDNFFVFSFMDASQPAEEPLEGNYLLTPLRGLLAVVTVLSALAASMYYIRDVKAGMFSWIPEKRQAIVEFGCQMICVLNVSLVSLVSLAISNLSASLGREAVILLLFAVCAALFSMTVRRLCGNLAILGTVLPLLAVVMLVVCPVFFDLGGLRAAQFLFPPTYYINAQNSDRFLMLMPVYGLILWLVYYLSGKLIHKK